jgi:hypothetical protein
VALGAVGVAVGEAAGRAVGWVPVAVGDGRKGGVGERMTGAADGEPGIGWAITPGPIPPHAAIKTASIARQIVLLIFSPLR